MQKIVDLLETAHVSVTSYGKNGAFLQWISEKRNRKGVGAPARRAVELLEKTEVHLPV